MKLSKRLSMVASFVKRGSIIADIGTDHAYLPTWLITNGICEKAIAADIGKGPLLNAKSTVEKYSLENCIKLILSDGLKNIDLDSIDTVVLAGMGGDLICNILSGADIKKLKRLHIIAQPQSHAEVVRAFFMKNGFEIKNESICKDAKHYYICMSAVYSQKFDYPDYYEFYGELSSVDDGLVREYFDNQIFHLDRKREALSKCGKDSEAEAIERIISAVNMKIGEKKNEG